MAHSQTNYVLVYARMYAVTEKGVVGRVSVKLSTIGCIMPRRGATEEQQVDLQAVHHIK